MTTTREITLGSLRLGGGNPLFLIAGPCVIESEAHARKMAEQVARIAADAGVPYIFKASYDKANRSSVKSFRGPGLKEGLRILVKIKQDLNLPILTDIHDPSQALPAAEVCDILQIPAFLSRQTDLLEAAAKTGRIVNVKKGPVPFALGHDQRRRKNRQRRQRQYHPYRTRRILRLSEPRRRHALVPHPAKAGLSGRLRRDPLRATTRRPRPRERRPTRIHRTSGPRGVAAGVDGIFLETHDNPAAALSDGANALPLSQLASLLGRLKELSTVSALEHPMTSSAPPP